MNWNELATTDEMIFQTNEKYEKQMQEYLTVGQTYKDLFFDSAKRQLEQDLRFECEIPSGNTDILDSICEKHYSTLQLALSYLQLQLFYKSVYQLESNSEFQAVFYNKKYNDLKTKFSQMKSYLVRSISIGLRRL